MTAHERRILELEQTIRDMVARASGHGKDVQYARIVAIGRNALLRACCNFHRTGGPLGMGCGGDEFRSKH